MLLYCTVVWAKNRFYYTDNVHFRGNKETGAYQGGEGAYRIFENQLVFSSFFALLEARGGKKIDSLGKIHLTRLQIDIFELNPNHIWREGWAN